MLVCVVDAELLEAVVVEILEAEDVEHPDTVTLAVAKQCIQCCTYFANISISVSCRITGRHLNYPMLPVFAF